MVLKNLKKMNNLFYTKKMQVNLKKTNMKFNQKK